MSCRVGQFRAEVEASHRRPRSADHKPGWCTGVYVTLGASSLGNLRDPNVSVRRTAGLSCRTVLP